jgi:5-methyltetrahydrofolate--homocysteine methyltransferase
LVWFDHAFIGRNGLAKELDKQNIKFNRLVVQTSRAHTAVKLLQYRQTVIHVNDASRAVTVASLLNSDKKIYAASIREEYDAFRRPFEPFER